ncbi:rDNA polynucleotide kinase GRC3 [Metarhizium robertsii]|uniref:Polynucleotide 5'-hydroxyl-kinase GRC3 n=1 Tax=Metarhizium robertsii TaxID=568076 RepID=A0A0A1V9N5_9HYPO|nr:rDNA polynucleotide kinase GRC3 [Metarhizium robertsii]
MVKALLSSCHGSSTLTLPFYLAPVSAVSAIAARRRQAASVAQSQATEPANPAEPLTPSVNSFSALQTLRPDRKVTRPPKKSSKQSVQLRNDGRRLLAVDDPKAAESNCRTKAGGALELTLDEGERFLVLGSFGIRVVGGEVTLAGATLHAAESIHWVSAPHCVALPVIRTVQDTRLELHNDPNTSGLRKLGRLSPLFRRIWNEPSETVDGIMTGGQTFQIIVSSSDAPRRCVIQELVSPPEWNKKLASLLSISGTGTGQRTTFVCGPKSAGKSTFSRLLTNRLLTSSNAGNPVKRVAVLDLDPGQPEFAPPGTVSLVCVSNPNFGVPFTHTAFDDPSNTILRCHSLASVTPASAPDLLVSCATDLYDTYQRSLRTCPLIINTPGWILGTGLDLLVELITRIRPAEVIYMSEDGPADVVDVLKNATKNSFSMLPSQPSEFTSRTAAHFRSMQMMSYYHSHIDIENKRLRPPRVTWSGHAISSARPFVVSYHGNNSGIFGIISYDYQCTPELLAASINGSILAMVEIEGPEAFRQLTDITKTPEVVVTRTAEDLPFIPNPNDATLDPQYCRTIGLVLIRGLDLKRKCLQVITPTPYASLEKIKVEERNIVLVHGRFDTPYWAYTEDLFAKSSQEELVDKEVHITDEETSEDESREEKAQPGGTDHAMISTIPWIEVLDGTQKRPVGSRVWRVRRDLGRHNTD